MSCQMSKEQFAQYVKVCADNVLDREQKRRFDYDTLNRALKAVKQAEYAQVPRSVMELFGNITDFVFRDSKQQLSDEEQIVLMLVLLNIHMAYGLM